MKLYLIFSFEHDAWWMPNRSGYTQDVAEAGLYSGKDASRICRDANQYLGAGKVNEEMRPASDYGR